MSSKVAIIGAACRLPGADSVQELWELVQAGRTTFETVTPEESTRYGYKESHVEDSAFIPVRSTLSDFDTFDAEYFGIPTHEAVLMDPQQRVFLETVWSALEDSGHARDHKGLRVGLFGSTSGSTYLTGPLAEAGIWDPPDINFSAMLANEKDFLCTRTSYTLGLTGPSVVLQSACSSSLLATHAARLALLDDECDLAVVGGVSISLPYMGGYLHRTGGIFSPKGTCRPFDAAAEGTVKGNGAAAIVLRKAHEAEADRDYIYSFLAGVAVNNDGSDKAGYAAPSIQGQSEVLVEAMRDAQTGAEDIVYTETHGTGTQLGDPIEARALTKARNNNTGAIGYLGSIKANMGHLDAAAGITGLLKTALVLQHQTVPPLTGFSQANPWLDLDGAGLRAPTETIRPAGGIPAAAVSSFGMGGTNVHAVLHRAEPTPRTGPPHNTYRVVLSAPTVFALRRSAERLRLRLTQQPALRIDDVAYTLETGRRPERYSMSVTASAIDELAQQLPAAEIEDQGKSPEPDHPVLSDSNDYTHARRVPLPGTVYERRRFWIETPTAQDNDGDEVLHMMRSLLTDADLQPDDDFFEAGADSLTVIDLIAKIKDTVGTNLEYSDVERARTAANLSEIIAEPGSDTDPGNPTAADRPRGSDPAGHDAAAPQTGRVAHVNNIIPVTGKGTRNIFLAHPAGGTVTCYADLSRYVDESINIFGLYYPTEYVGHSLTMRELAAQYVRSIRAHQPEGPYLIGGYSFGGNLAVEMALQLEQAGADVETLVLIDSHPPHAYTQGDCSPEAYLDAFPDLLRAVMPDVQFGHGLSSAATPADVINAVTAPDWNEGMRRELEGFFTVWRENHTALKRWTPDRVPSCPAIIFEAAEPEPANVLEALDIGSTSVREWNRYLGADIQFVPVDGDHYSIFRGAAALEQMGQGMTDALDI